MLKFALCIVAGSLVALGLGATSAQAQTRVFVAAQGSDNNPCTFAAPCRTFQHAHDTVAAGGEINVLDPAGYGMLTISKSIRIEGHGFAGITASSGAKAILITAAAADRVTLRGLNIDGGGVALDGVNSQLVGTLTVEDCEIHDFTGTGVFVTGIAGTNLFVSSTRATNSQYGVYVWPAELGVIGSITGFEAYNDTYGIAARSTDTTGGAPVVLSVTNSTVSNSSAAGVYADSPNGQQTAIVYIMNSVVFNKGSYGLYAHGGTIIASRSLLRGDAGVQRYRRIGSKLPRQRERWGWSIRSNKFLPVN